ncbi:MAG: hypothetical protein K2G25_05290 [Oscillospiraceae bacterium]|nr:hypothetical protein [Oscillospiraceae bacterium]
MGISKNIYSLVLSDDVIRKVDQLAYEMHTSRSNCINQILAEHLSCVTPEMRMQRIFASLEDLVQEQFRMLGQTSANIFALQSRLDYKYKPTILYSVEIYPDQNYTGKLKIKLRTQNQTLIAALDEFFRFWIALESCYFPEHPVEYRITPGRLERSVACAGLHTDQSGLFISEYIRRFDQYLKAWFAGESPDCLERKFAGESAKIEQFI